MFYIAYEYIVLMPTDGFRKAKGRVFETNITTTTVNGQEYYRCYIPKEAIRSEELRSGNRVRLKIEEWKE